ncbi:DMT family transporter [Halobacillus shinanisalinarum]|uniref:DMT family transporter n=1 Tax=Halobacillus shinanisalinarum TaxID=2932258 RepID=A0ABY4H319_9BACI|nr:DMT family transporter [Halobacillus shinanisalinarum]UOQ94514.1 DMT family transporter [Halobacillus shinanisalinarum]
MLMLVMMLWGFNVSAIKVLVSNMDPILLTSVRIFTAGIAVLAILGFMKILRLPTKKEAWIIFYISIFNVIAHHSFMALGLLYTSGVNAGLIVGMGPLLTMVLSTILLSKKVTIFKSFGFVLGFVGVIATTLTGAGGMTAVSIGDVMVFISIAVQAFSFILISKMNPELDPRLLTGYMMVLGSIFIFFISMMVETNPGQITQLFDVKLMLIFLFSALICTAFGHMVYNFAIQQVGPAESAIFINFNTFFAIVGAALFLNERIMASHIAGLVLIVCGVLIGTGAFEYIVGRKKRARSA